MEENNEKHAELLGIRIQCNLKWSLQIETLVRKLQTRLNGLEKLRWAMKMSKRKTIVEGVFNSVLCYCLPVFGGCNNAEIQMLQVQQSRAARLVLRMPPRTTRHLMLDKLGWLSVQQMISYHTLLAIFRMRQTKEPEDLASILTRENITGHIRMKNIELGLYRESFIFRGAVSWSKLPLNLRKEVKIRNFKIGLRVWVKENIIRFVD